MVEVELHAVVPMDFQPGGGKHEEFVLVSVYSVRFLGLRKAQEFCPGRTGARRARPGDHG